MILITRRFPYFTTEAFIESEIEYVANAFDEVIIFPSEIGSFKRQLPSNVTIVDDFSKVFQNKKSRALKTLISSFFYKAILDHKKEIKNMADLKLVFKFASSFLAYYDFFSKRQEITNANLVYTYWLNEAPLALSEVRKKSKIGFKLISRAHRYDLYEGISATPSFWPYRQKTIDGVDCIHSISKSGKDYLDQKYHTNTSSIAVSKLGVKDRCKFADNSEIGFYRIVSVSRVHKMKRVEFILESVSEFAKTVPETKVIWTHFGDGPDLNSIIDNSRIYNINNIHFDFKGNVSNEDIYEHYSSVPVDMFINLSSSEGIPVSIMEAQSFGIPVVATNVGGSGEIVVAETGVLLSDYPTKEEVVSAIVLILVEKRFDKKTIKEYWSNNFNAEKNYSEFGKSILKLIS